MNFRARQSGFALLGALLATAVVIGGLTLWIKIQGNENRNTRFENLTQDYGMQVSILFRAAGEYADTATAVTTLANNAKLIPTVAQLITAGNLPTGFTMTTPFGSTLTLTYLKDAAGDVSYLMSDSGLPDDMLTGFGQELTDAARLRVQTAIAQAIQKQSKLITGTINKNTRTGVGVGNRFTVSLNSYLAAKAGTPLFAVFGRFKALAGLESDGMPKCVDGQYLKRVSGLWECVNTAMGPVPTTDLPTFFEGYRMIPALVKNESGQIRYLTARIKNGMTQQGVGTTPSGPFVWTNLDATKSKFTMFSKSGISIPCKTGFFFTVPSPNASNAGSVCTLYNMAALGSQQFSQIDISRMVSGDSDGFFNPTVPITTSVQTASVNLDFSPICSADTYGTYNNANVCFDGTFPRVSNAFRTGPNLSADIFSADMSATHMSSTMIWVDDGNGGATQVKIFLYFPVSIHKKFVSASYTSQPGWELDQ